MRILKYIFLASLVLLVAACSSRTPEPLLKEDVQTSAQEDFELLKKSPLFGMGHGQNYELFECIM